jgi:phosphoenolpyruvate-protein phosphotransferase (PTS system enzyme I)
MSIQVFGLAVSRGVAIGRAVLVGSSRFDVSHHFIDPTDSPQEVARLLRARDEVSAELMALKQDVPEEAHAELVALLDVHLMMLHDPMLTESITQWIIGRHYNAEWAVSSQLEVMSRQFDEMEDDYLRERKADIEQVSERLLKVLIRNRKGAAAPLGELEPARAREFAGEDPLVLVANDIAPADMLQFKRSLFTGFVTDVGGRTSHTAIVARSMDIPAVVGTREASRLVRQDDWVIIDGDAGVLIVNPPPMVLEEYRFRQRQAELERARLRRLRNTAAVTLDGQSVELLANIELPSDVPGVLESGACGVGLFRSEFLFMNRGGNLPGEEEQYEAYRSVVVGLNGMPVTIRTVDVGADKPLDRLSVQELRHEHGLNPALGLRAIRWSLSEPEMFAQQLRAILRAAAHGPVRVLVPMIAHLHEVRQVQSMLAQARADLVEKDMAHGPVTLGAMIEIPAAVLILPSLLRHFEFVSIGTNDLIQYALAIDRADETVAHLYDAWHPAVLRLVAQTIAEANAMGKGVSVCGEMAGDPAFTDLLLAMGLRSFSMHPAQIGSIKQRVLRADIRGLQAALPAVLASDDPQEVAAALFKRPAKTLQ